MSIWFEIGTQAGTKSDPYATLRDGKCQSRTGYHPALS